MAAQKGRDFLIKVEDSPGAGTFTLVGGLRAKSLRTSFGSADASSTDSAWRALLAGAGLKMIDVSGNGVFKADSPWKKVYNSCFNGSPLNYQIVAPSLGTFQGTFVVDDMDLGAQHDNEVGYSTSFKSSGEIVYTPAA